MSRAAEESTRQRDVFDMSSLTLARGVAERLELEPTPARRSRVECGLCRNRGQGRGQPNLQGLSPHSLRRHLAHDS